MTDYRLMERQMEELLRGGEWEITGLANAAAMIWETLPDINWAGFYLMRDGRLCLGPFQGRAACTVIEAGRGVCGAAAAEDRTQLVPDVHAFPGHIACDSASRSEIVVPLHSGGRVAGVLDIDSPLEGRFTDEDQAGLEMIARVIERMIELDTGRL